MKENKLADMSMSFSVQIIDLVKDLKAKHETVISNQIGRSGTSIGANIREAQYAHGKSDRASERERPRGVAEGSLRAMTACLSK